MTNFAKLLVVIVGAAAIGAALLGMRQQRLQIMHQMAQLYRQMDQSRQETWDLQVEIAQRIRPEALRAAAERASLVLEPVMPADPSPPSVAAMPLVEVEYARR